MKEIAEAYLSKPVKNAVVTVLRPQRPAHHQRAHRSCYCIRSRQEG
jgi:molecular chaperone DnaK (HSP70)